jgi:hypothetical protein
MATQRIGIEGWQTTGKYRVLLNLTKSETSITPSPSPEALACVNRQALDVRNELANLQIQQLDLLFMEHR